MPAAVSTARFTITCRLQTPGRLAFQKQQFPDFMLTLSRTYSISSDER